MDCGKEFLAVIEDGTNKPLNCYYYGRMKTSMKYQWTYPWNPDKFEREGEKPTWQRWLKEYIPGYCYPDDLPSVKSIFRRWYLLFMNQFVPEVEMWTCPDCLLEYEIS